MQSGSPDTLPLRRWPHWPVIGVLVLGCLTTAAVGHWLKDKARVADQTRFHEEAVAHMEAIETRIELLVEMLQRLSKELSRAPARDRAHWNDLVRDLNLRGNYPGLSGVGFWKYDPPPEPEWIETWRSIGLTPPQHAGGRGKGGFAAVFFSQPCEQPPDHFITRDVAERLELDGDLWGKITWCVGVGPGASPGLEVFNEISREKDRGFRVLLPVFSPERHPRGVIHEHFSAARRATVPGEEDLFAQNDWGNLLGVIYGEFAMKQFIASTLGHRMRAVVFRISDATQNWRNDPNTVLPIYEDAAPVDSNPYQTEQLEMKHYGRRLVFDFRTTPEFDMHSLRYWPLTAGAFGGVLTLLLAGLVFSQTRARAREESDAARLRAANEQLETALRDRERISRELHDGALQSIYSVGLGLTRYRKLLSTHPERASELLAESIDSLNAIVVELRQFLLTLEADVIQGGSVEPVLQTLARRVEATTSAHVILKIDSATAAAMTTGQAVNVLNIVREAVSNSFRHGEPSQIQIRLIGNGTGWRLEVQDNGGGFEVMDVDGTGHGLQNMRARATEMGAAFVLESKPGSGTIVRVECSSKPA